MSVGHDIFSHRAEDLCFNAYWTRESNQHVGTLLFWYNMHEMCGCQRSLNFSSSMRVYMRADFLSVDAADQASLMFSSVEGK